jgi:P-type Ca2+ transporter type 2C
MARDEYNTVFDRNALPGATQLRRYGTSLLAIVLVTSLGFLQRIFGTVELGLSQWALCAGLALSLLVVEEILKLVLRRTAGVPSEVPSTPASAV